MAATYERSKIKNFASDGIGLFAVVLMLAARIVHAHTLVNGVWAHIALSIPSVLHLDVHRTGRQCDVVVSTLGDVILLTATVPLHEESSERTARL